MPRHSMIVVDVGVENFLVTQLARRLDRLGHGGSGRFDVKHVAHVVLGRGVHDEGAMSATERNGLAANCAKLTSRLDRFRGRTSSELDIEQFGRRPLRL